MTRLHYTIFVICILIGPHLSKAQEFQKAFTDFNVANDFSRDQDGNIYSVGYTSFIYDSALDEIVSLDIINKINPAGEVEWSKDFEISSSLTEIQKVLAMPIGDIIVLFTIDRIGEELQMGFARVSAQGDIVWAQSLDIDIVGFDEFNTQVNLFPADGNNFFVQSKKVNSTQQTHLLTKCNGSGNALWTRSYTTDLKISTSNIVELDEDRLALIGHYTTDTNETRGILIILDAEGRSKISRTFSNLEIQGVIPDENGYIVKFKTALFSTAGIMKLDNNLDPIWAKSLDFEVEGQIGNISKFEDAFVLYVYDNRSRIELLASYDMEGEPLWAKYINSKYSGRPFTEKVDNADGQVLVMSNIWTTNLKSSIFRQLPIDGNTTDCILPIACISNTDMLVFNEPINFAEGNPTAILSPIMVNLNSTTKSTSDFCEETEGVPSPLFEMDSTACINQEVMIFNTDNDGADDIFWDIEGGPDDAILPLANLNNGLPLVFADSGLYTITQNIVYRDCITSYSQQTKISDGQPFAFAEDSLILCIDEVETVNVNRPGFVSYLWQDDNSRDPIKKIDSPGIYTVELYDGFCTKNYDLVVENFDYGGIEFSLGPDTTVCEFRRFTLAADKIIDGVDYLWSDGVTSGERFASKEGLYSLSVFLDGCDFVDDINVTFEPCEPQVYVPNIFTPNADGINDTLYPDGQNFELESFKIYNRWGALLHDSLTPWDGIQKDQIVSGMYVWKISFLNERSGDIESLAGSTYLSR